jgi:hypothetical protein
MAISETARLIASLELKDLFSKQVDSASKSLGKLDKSLDSSQSRAYKAGTQIGTGIKRGAAIAVAGIGLLATQVALGIKSLDGLEKVTTQTDAVLKSTHDVSKQTSAGIRDMANEFENLNATIDDTVIQSGANVLLTFTNIREKAFKPTIQAALDMNQALGGGESGLQGTIQRIGRALNDPIKGLGQLTRVGVTFTAEEKKKIAELVKSNNLYVRRLVPRRRRDHGGQDRQGQGRDRRPPAGLGHGPPACPRQGCRCNVEVPHPARGRCRSREARPADRRPVFR